MSIFSRIKGRGGASGFGYASTAEEVTEGIDLRGKTALITGVNSGLGQETARVLAMRGAHVLAVARTMDKAQAAAEDMPEATAFACELSSPDSVRSCVAEVRASGRTIDILICNAGIMALPKLRQEQGYELQFFTNHVGHFILVTGLLDSLTEDARVVMLSSEGHRLAIRGLELDNLSGEKHYSQWRAYGRSKLANLLFAVELARRFEGSQRTANAVHPGVIRTNLGRHMNAAENAVYSAIDMLYAKSVPQGAATTCYVATSPGLAATRGEYFSDCNLARASRKGRDPQLARRLWLTTEEILTRVGS
jgi:WW domain-containing oxidoreductase